jgi:glycosyltransferase involved in cell wall biosynthesis
MFPAASPALLGLPLIRMTPELQEPQPAAASWPLHDYTSPGLSVVRPDASFPHMRPGDALNHPWKYLRRDVPHIWYVDERFPLMGFLNRDEATLLHNIALQFAGKRALELGSWLGWSTCHLALAGVVLDVIDPSHDDPSLRASIDGSLALCGVSDRVSLLGGRSPESISAVGHKWSLFFIDGDHEEPAPLRDTIASLPYAADDCAFVFHDLASPSVAAGLRFLAEKGFHVVVYQTAQIMGLAWRGNVTPVTHFPDPEVAWQVPVHLAGLPISGVDFKPLRSSSYRQLREIEYGHGDDRTDSGMPLRPSVCIVTSEIIGPFKNGGIGTSMTGLAEILAGDGLPVTVLYTGGIWSPDVGLSRWRKHYAALGIELTALTIEDMKTIAGPLKDRGFGVPWLVYRYLAEHRFDVIHFNDCGGEGSLSIAAKRLGLGFDDALLVVALHSPSRWVLELNQMLPTSLLLSAYHYAEQLGVSRADMLWCPSRYLLDWAVERDFEYPPQTFLQQYAMPSQRVREGAVGPASPPSVPYGRHAAPREIVFFGRLEERKGLRLFCNALHLLRDELARRGTTVTFLGKPERCAGMPSLDYIAQRAAAWRFPIRTLIDLGQPEALQYLRGGEKLAVMASPFDNSPCTVYEALSWGIPFLAARTGGIPEIVDEADHDYVLFDGTTESLAAALHDVLQDGAWIARPALPQEEIRRSWIAMHAHWRRFLPRPEHAVLAPFGVAVLIDHPGGAPLDVTLQSLGQCPAISRLIVLNRSGEPLPSTVRSIDLRTEDPGALDDELAKIGEEAVLMIHSGVRVLEPAFDAMLQSLAAAPVDGLLPAARLTDKSGSRVVPPLGGSPAFSLFEGVTFTGALLVRRQSLFAAKAGRPFAVDSPFMGLSDFCVAGNARIWPYPAPVVELPDDCVIAVRSSLPARVAAYDDASSTERYYMLAAGYGAVNQERLIAPRREVALAAVDLGLAPLIRIASWALRRLRRWIR